MQRRFASGLLNKRIADRIMTVELNAPPVNLLTRPLLTEFADTYSSIKPGGDVGAVVLTSAMPGIFTAGLDIMEIYQRSDEQIFEYWSMLQELWMALYACPVPVIAAINGTCPAAGCLMACSVDYRIMLDHPKYQIGLNETQLGFAAPDWLCWLYQDIIGKRQGELHLQLGSLFSASEAKKLGLIDQVAVDQADLNEQVRQFAIRILRVPPKPVALTKQLLRAPYLDYLKANRECDAQRFIAQVQAEQTQRDIGQFLEAMKQQKA